MVQIVIAVISGANGYYFIYKNLGKLDVAKVTEDGDKYAIAA